MSTVRPPDNAPHQNADFFKNKKEQEPMHGQAKNNKTCLNPNCGHSWYAHWGKDHSLTCMICFCSKFTNFLQK
jgi:hypothetical protein